MRSAKPVLTIHLFGLEVSVMASAAALTMVLMVAAAGLRLMRGGSLLGAVGFGLGVAVVHTGSCLGHHLGHAFAARLTGFPMQGIVAKDLIWRSAYPQNEPILPSLVHAKRALGGPAASLVLTGVSVVAWLATRAGPIELRRLMLVAMIDTGVVFSLGSLLPLGFTDGSTLLNLLRWGRPEK